jgi:hypothetical protein
VLWTLIWTPWPTLLVNRARNLALVSISWALFVVVTGTASHRDAARTRGGRHADDS